MRRHDAQFGFTLTEVMVSIVGILVVIGIVVTTLFSSSQFVGGSVRRMSSQTALRNALDSMAAELQWAHQNTVILSQHNGSSRIEFQNPVGVVAELPQLSTLITYRADPSSVDANGNGLPDDAMIVRVQNGTTKVVCQYLQNGGLVMTRAGDQLTLQVTVIMPNGRGEVMNYSGSTTIKLKNGS